MLSILAQAQAELLEDARIHELLASNLLGLLVATIKRQLLDDAGAHLAGEGGVFVAHADDPLLLRANGLLQLGHHLLHRHHVDVVAVIGRDVHLLVRGGRGGRSIGLHDIEQLARAVDAIRHLSK